MISRTLSPYFVRIILPMAIIWALSYLSHFWRDSSPASRFSGASMIAAIALTLGVRSFIPPFNYLMAINVAFLGLYICIAFDAITTAAVFLTRGAGHPERAERIRLTAIVLSPVLAVGSLTSAWFVSSHGIRDSLFQRPPSVSVAVLNKPKSGNPLTGATEETGTSNWREFGWQVEDEVQRTSRFRADSLLCAASCKNAPTL